MVQKQWWCILRVPVNRTPHKLQVVSVYTLTVQDKWCVWYTYSYYYYYSHLNQPVKIICTRSTTTTKKVWHRAPLVSLLGLRHSISVSLSLECVFFTLTDRASTIPSNIRGCQSGTGSQRGTKVNGSHHGDNPLHGPTGIQIATKSYATLQAMAPTNNKTVHQTSLTPYREQPRSTRIAVAYPRPAFSATNRTNTFQPVLINNIPSFSRPHIVQK